MAIERVLLHVIASGFDMRYTRLFAMLICSESMAASGSAQLQLPLH